MSRRARQKHTQAPVPKAVAVPRAEGSAFDRFVGREGGRKLPGRSDYVVLGVVYPLLLAVYFLPLLSGGKLLASEYGDIANEWYGMRVYLGTVLKQLRIPLWNPYLMSGTPYLAASQTGVFFPPNWMFGFMSVTAVLNLQILTSFWAGMAGMHVLARVLGRSTPASMVAGLVFGFSGFAVHHWFAGHIVFVNEWPHTPLAVVAWQSMQGRVARSCKLRDLLLPLLGMSACLAVQFFSGHPQIVYFTLVILMCLQAGWAVYAVRQGVGRLAATGSAWLVAAFALAGFLVMVQALPTLLHTRETIRAGEIGMAYYEEQSQPISNIITLFAPYAWGGYHGAEDQFGRESFWEVNAYVGPIAFTLALLCFMVPRRTSPLQWTSAAVVFFASWIALGEYGGLYRLAFRLVPGFSLFRNPGRTLYLVVFFFALLSSSGLDAMAQWARDRAAEYGKALTRLAVLLSVAVLLLGLGYLAGPRSSFFSRQALGRAPDTMREIVEKQGMGVLHSMYFQSVLLAMVTSGIVLGFLGAMRFDFLRPRIAWALSLLLLLELSVYAWPVRISYDPATCEWPEPMKKIIREAGPRYRVGSGKVVTDFNQVLCYGVRHVWGYEPASAQRYALPMLKSQGVQISNMAVTFLFTRNPSPFLDALGMRYMIFEADFKPDYPDWRPVGTGGRRVLYENPYAIPRAITVPRHRVVTSAEAVEAVIHPEFNAHSTVVLEEQPELPVPESSGSNAPGRVEIVRDDAESFAATVTMQKPGWFVLMDTYMPGWNATVDGSPARMYRANAVGRALYLPGGTHRVEMEYRAPGFRAGAWISGFACIAWLALALVRLFPIVRKRWVTKATCTDPAPGCILAFREQGGRTRTWHLERRSDACGRAAWDSPLCGHPAAWHFRSRHRCAIGEAQTDLAVLETRRHLHLRPASSKRTNLE